MPQPDKDGAAPPTQVPAGGRHDATPASAHASRGHGLLKIVLEVALITLGVFLALIADEWREDAQNRQMALSSLRAFRTELAANRKAVALVKDYHVALQGRLRAYLAADPRTRRADAIQLRGVQPVFFEDTAWQLAIATQSLAHIEQALAFRISRVYGLQRTYTDESRSILQVIFMKPLVENFDGLVSYFGDIVIWEPRLLQQYDEVLPLIDRALQQPSAATQ